jgi:hypothetical protein
LSLTTLRALSASAPTTFSDKEKLTMANLDGKDKIAPTPFDAHEQVARVQHEAAPNAPGYVHSGLKAVDPEDAVTEFPKAVDHVDHPSGVGQEPILVKSADEEDEYRDAKAAEAKAAEQK